MIKTVSICIRLSEEEMEQLEDIAFFIEDSTGVSMSKSAALRLCLNKYFEIMRKEGKI